MTKLSTNLLTTTIRAMDLTMMEIGNAKERDLTEWQTLLEQADPRLKFRELYQPAGSRLAIVEAVWEG